MCYLLFAACLLVSGVIGCICGYRVPFAFAPAAPAISVVGFLISYCGACLPAIAAVERKKEVAFQRPSIVLGVALSAALPFLLVILAVLLLIVSQMISPMHDSM